MHVLKKRLVLHRFNFNKVVALLTFSDLFTWGPQIVLSTLAGLYLVEKLSGNIVEIVGLGTSVAFIARATLQLPIGYLTDRIRRDRDEIIILFLGCIFMGFPFLLYPLISEAWMYYVLQFIFGAGASMNLNTWRKLFAKNVNEEHEGREYAVYETAMSVSTAALTAIGGFVASLGQHYFDLVIVGAGTMIIIGGIWAGMIYFVRSRKTNQPPIEIAETVPHDEPTFTSTPGSSES